MAAFVHVCRVACNTWNLKEDSLSHSFCGSGILGWSLWVGLTQVCYKKVKGLLAVAQSLLVNQC